MTLHKTYYCDFCNLGRTETPGEGFIITLGREVPDHWWEVPGEGPNGSVGHACPECVATNPDAQRKLAITRDQATMELAARLEEKS